MNILAIDTSCDETSVAITNGMRVVSNVVYSQILLHQKWGGVVPSIAKRAHEERIDLVVEQTLKKWRKPVSRIDMVAVTQGPGLAIALEVGIKKAKNLAIQFKKPLIPVNHLEGHIYSPFVQNSCGNPNRKIKYPFLGLVVSGGHTSIVLVKDDGKYEVLGETVDDAAGEALDKAAKMLGAGYPGGAIIERFARNVHNQDKYSFPRPMIGSNNLQFSFSGLKTSLYYFLQKQTKEEVLKNIEIIASSYQEAVFDTIIKKASKAIDQTHVKQLAVGGGVIANLYLRKKFKILSKKKNIEVFFPPYPYLSGDNAAMIGVAAHLKLKGGFKIPSIDSIDRIARMQLC